MILASLPLLKSRGAHQFTAARLPLPLVLSLVFFAVFTGACSYSAWREDHY